MGTENIGARMVKEVASKTSDVAGDGTTTATVLTAATVPVPQVQGAEAGTVDLGCERRHVEEELNSARGNPYESSIHRGAMKEIDVHGNCVCGRLESRALKENFHAQ